MILGVVPYVYPSVAAVKVLHVRKAPARTFQAYEWIAIAAVAYGIWTVIGGDPETVVYAMVALLVSVPLCPFFLRSMEAAAESKRAFDAGQTPGVISRVADPRA